MPRVQLLSLVITITSHLHKLFYYWGNISVLPYAGYPHKGIGWNELKITYLTTFSFLGLFAFDFLLHKSSRFSRTSIISREARNFNLSLTFFCLISSYAEIPEVSGICTRPAEDMSESSSESGIKSSESAFFLEWSSEYVTSKSESDSALVDCLQWKRQYKMEYKFDVV